VNKKQRVSRIVRFRDKHPFAITGWLWYMVTLRPVIGLTKKGNFAHADRYTYKHLIGIEIMVSWGFPEIKRVCLKALSLYKVKQDIVWLEHAAAKGYTQWERQAPSL